MTLDYLRLATTQGGLIKDDPLAIFKRLPMAPRWELEYYLARKREYFERSVHSYDDMSEDERVMALGQALEFPFGVASRMLQYSKPFAWQCVGAMRGPVVMLYPSLVSNRVRQVFGTLLAFNTHVRWILRCSSEASESELYRELGYPASSDHVGS
jgi:hypothetical protein